MKKAISLLLSIILLVSVVTVAPISVGAADTSSQDYTSKVNEDIDVNGRNSLGAMLAERLENSSDTDEEKNTSGIYELKMDNNVAHVEIQTAANATLIVAVYDESTDKMYTSGMADVTKDDKFVVVEMNTDALPEYYIVRAFLVDRETKTPLCKQYECDTYTRIMQEFLSKTTDDFAEDEVLNLDASKDNNFLVYNEDTIVVDNSDESKNIVQSADEENREYVIDNIDDTIASLQEGDIFTYEYGNDGLLIIKVSSIRIDGTTATIYGEEIALEEAFDYIKIDVSDYSNEAHVDNSELDEGVEYIGEGKTPLAPVGSPLIDDKLSLATSLEYKIKEKKFGKDSSVSGNLSFKAEVEFSCYYDAKLFEKDEVKMSVKLNYELSLGVKLELKGVFAEIPLGRIGFSPIAGVYVEFTPVFVLEGEASVELKGSLNGRVGKIFKEGKFYDDNKTPSFDAELKFEAKLFVGISLEPKIGVLADVVSVTMKAKSGLQIKAELEYTTDDHETLGERHLCKSCVEGELSYAYEVGIEFSILKKENLTWKALAIEYTKKFADFYYSVDNNKFAFTSCPNKAFRQIIKVIDTNGIPVPYATVNGTQTNSKGEVVLYLTKGEHALCVEGGGASKSLCIMVKEARVHTFTLNGESSSGSSALNGTISASGRCGENMYYKIYNTTLEIYGSGDMYHDFYLSEVDKSIKKVIIKNGVTSIGYGAFAYCNSLSSITIPNSVTSIGSRAFAYCRSLSSITIPSSVTSIGDSAFKLCASLSSVTIPSGVTSIGDGAFEECYSLSSITIPNSVTSIGEGAFGRCYSLSSITIPNSVTSIGWRAFVSCRSLSSITIPSSVIYIESNTFELCTSLSSVTIPSGVTSIGSGAFYGCNSLKNVYYDGTISQWDKMDIGSYNDCLTNANIHFNSGKVVAETAFGINAKKADIALLGENYTKTYSREHLVAGSEALFVVVEGDVDSYEVSPETLLYIGQTTIDENGCTSVVAPEFFDAGETIALIFGDCDHSSSHWTTSFEPTDKEEGLKVCICDYCENIIDTEVIDALAKNIIGDVDDDGRVSISDATMIQKHLVQMAVIEDKKFACADTDKDGMISIKDATLIQKFIAALVPSL